MVKETGNNGKGNTEERDDWWTPQWLFDHINKQYHFGFDCCANYDNTKCSVYSEDFLKEIGNGIGICWMNPPFSKAEKMFKHFFKIVPCGVCIYRCDNMETKVWQDIILKYATWIFIPRGRISYEGKKGKGSRFPSALIGFNVNPPCVSDGTTLYLNGEIKNG